MTEREGAGDGCWSLLIVWVASGKQRMQHLTCGSGHDTSTGVVEVGREGGRQRGVGSVSIVGAARSWGVGIKAWDKQRMQHWTCAPGA
jgi:hypothetical protein